MPQKKKNHHDHGRGGLITQETILEVRVVWSLDLPLFYWFHSAKDAEQTFWFSHVATWSPAKKATVSDHIVSSVEGQTLVGRSKMRAK